MPSRGGKKCYLDHLLSLSLFLYIHIYIYIYIYICTRNSLGILQGFYEFLGPRGSQEVLGGPRRSQEVLGSPILLVESE